MNTIGISNNLDRPRIKKMLAVGLFASILTGIGDFFQSDEKAGDGTRQSRFFSCDKRPSSGKALDHCGR